LIKKTRAGYFLTLIIILMVKILYAQTVVDSTLAGRIISKIKITGNNRTKKSVILREMKLKEGSLLDPEQLEKDRKRIESLMVFNRVVIKGEPDSTSVLLEINVTEQLYFIPFPVLFINDRDWSKVSYGAGFIHTNFSGMTDKLGIIFWAGYDPSIHFVYYNPWMGKKYNLLAKIEFFYAKIRNKHYTENKVYEFQKGFEWSLGKRWGHHLYGEISVGYKSLKMDTPDGNGENDRLPGLGFSVMYDKRDLVEFPLSGYLLRMIVRTAGLPGAETFYQQVGSEVRAYIPVTEKSSFAFRFKSAASVNNLPVYDRYYLGYSERIRGHYNEIYEGDSFLIGGIGFRFPILGIRYFSISNIPQLRNLKLGLYGSLFIDSGAVWFKRAGLKRKDIISGAGIGLDFILPYIHVIRLDFAVDEEGKSQFIVGFGVDI